ncbi:GNAT family N-acetyltransferase [Erysipelatoclostridium sp. AM42-17]|uniref:GNAT family N-acetyltransferase n=1 Tax=Erysipelatoclostridium sp. AM42-17 TaxID=2293102 RepID=UPI001F436B9C|nr:GNAT family N-acetyltransferase [Erysipelatoclostridium sp. AM42-17]
MIVIENDEEAKIGFAGINNQKLEMLFLLPDQRGKGIGKQVISYCIKQYNMNELTVNEQNPQAVGFYQHLGFKVYKRTALDEEGNPYPLLYMKR